MKRGLSILAFSLFPALAVGNDESREVREIRSAEASIFWALVSSASKEGRKACFQYPSICNEAAGELGLALLAEKSSPESLQAFSSLLKYRLDGGLSEDYTCYALSKKKDVLSHFAKLDADALNSDCQSRFNKAKALQPGFMQSVEVGSVCSASADIRNRAAELVDGIKREITCAPEDF